MWNIGGGVWCIEYIIIFIFFINLLWRRFAGGPRLGEKLKVIHFSKNYEAKVDGGGGRRRRRSRLPGYDIVFPPLEMNRWGKAP